jgi:hypothetical protein
MIIILWSGLRQSEIESECEAEAVGVGDGSVHGVAVHYYLHTTLDTCICFEIGGRRLGNCRNKKLTKVQETSKSKKPAPKMRENFFRSLLSRGETRGESKDDVSILPRGSLRLIVCPSMPPHSPPETIKEK